MAILIGFICMICAEAIDACRIARFQYSDCENQRWAIWLKIMKYKFKNLWNWLFWVIGALYFGPYYLVFNVIRLMIAAVICAFKHFWKMIRRQKHLA